jgi:hypothetical protein
LLLSAVLWWAGLSLSAQAANGILTVRVGAPPQPPIPLVNPDDLWRYRKGTSPPPIGWHTAPEAMLDSSWLNGPGGFGYGDNDDATIVADMQNNYTTVYIRKSFDVPSAAETNRQVRLVMDFDDGFVAWLDGMEIARTNAPGAVGTEPPYSAIATAGHEASGGDVPTNPPAVFDLGPAGNRLQTGAHVLAIQGLNAATNSSDFSLIAGLSLADDSSTGGGALFEIVNTNLVLLTGSNTIPTSTRVKVNGADALFSVEQGTWSKMQNLSTGFNRLSVQALDATGVVLAATNKDIVVELAVTEVGGTLAADAVWDSSMGIIHVTNNVVVPPGGALGIKGGAVLLFKAGASILASNASLTVSGTANSPVCFLPADGTTVWGGLVVFGTNGHLQVRHAEIAAGYVRLLEGAAGAVEDSYLHDYFGASPPIIHALRAASLVERRCHIARYYEQLIQRTPVVIEDCLCEHIAGDGIDFDGAPPGAVVRRCTLRRGDLTNVDGLDIGNFTDGTPSRGVVIEECLIYDFPFDKGVSIGERAQDITVRNCVIYAVESGVAVKDSSVATIDNNILWGNTNSISLANGSTLSVSYSDISGAGVFPGTGNLNVDPLFRDPARQDYRLATNSPALGVGSGGVNLGPLSTVGSLLVDTDADGLPDPWEWEYWLDFNDPTDAAADPDGDRLTNLQEFFSGTNPRDAASCLKLDAISLSGNAVSLRFGAVGGKSYSLQFRADVSGGEWQTLTEVPPAATNRVVEFPDPDLNRSGTRFYRLITPAGPG